MDEFTNLYPKYNYAYHNEVIYVFEDRILKYSPLKEES